MSLIPTPFPLEHYKHALQLQPSMGILMAGIIRQPEMIANILKKTAENDKFVERLLQVSKAFNDCEITDPRQDVHMVILRNDYMINQPSNSLELIEYNTIAAGMGPLNTKVKSVQEYVESAYLQSCPLNYNKLDVSGLHAMHKENLDCTD